MAPDAEIIPIRRRSAEQRALPVAEPLRRAAGDDGWWAGGMPSTAAPGVAGVGAGALAWPAGAHGGAVANPGRVPEWATAPSLPLRSGLRRRPSAKVLRRRRMVVAALVVGTLAVLLALPIQALAGHTAANGGAVAGTGAVAGAGAAVTQSAVVGGTGTAGATHLRPGSDYVVRPGDTLWSIATRLDPTGDPRSLVAQLEAQTGGRALVAGERLRLP